MAIAETPIRYGRAVVGRKGADSTNSSQTNQRVHDGRRTPEDRLGSKPVSQLMMDLGVTRSHSRPHVSNDNPFSEAAFKTLKYCPTFPERFGCIEDARAFCEEFFDYYNHAHRHSGIGLHTPASVHYGTHLEIRELRQATLSVAFELNPIRFRSCTHLPDFGSLTRYDTHEGWAPKPIDPTVCTVQMHWLTRGLGLRKVDHTTWNARSQKTSNGPHNETHDNQEESQYRCKSPPFDITQLLVTGCPERSSAPRLSTTKPF